MVRVCNRENGERLVVSIRNMVNSELNLLLLILYSVKLISKFCTIEVLKFIYVHKIFQQDNGPAHKTKKVFFSRTCICFVAKLEPDSNLFKNVWSLKFQEVLSKFGGIILRCKSRIRENAKRVLDNLIYQTMSCIAMDNNEYAVNMYECQTFLGFTFLLYRCSKSKYSMKFFWTLLQKLH